MGRIGRSLRGLPIVEGALVRFLVRVGERAAVAQEVLRRLRQRRGYEFWPDSLSYADARMDDVHGHRQVTDAYLVDLAAEQSATLATFDEGLAQTFSEGALLVPRLPQ